jgi:hypothetical protein
MPRKPTSATSSTGTTAVMDAQAASARAPVEPRPGADVRPDIVNVFEEGVSPGAPGLRLAPIGGRPASEGIALSVRAWVRNLAYDKNLWIDLALASGTGDLLHAESLPLSFQESAGGEGDFFTVGTAVPAPPPSAASSGTPSLLYRLYGQISGQLFTDGVLHRHEVAPVAPRSTRAAEAAEVRGPQPATPSRSRSAKPVGKPVEPKTMAATTPKVGEPNAAVKAPKAAGGGATARSAKAETEKAPPAPRRTSKPKP